MHILLALLVIVAANYLALRGLRRLRRGRQAALSVLVSVDAVLAVLLVLELGMSLFFAQSDGFNITLASRNWFARYWKPVNSLGYRDAAVTPRAPGEKIVLVLGDSFAAGQGIELAEDRLGNRLGRAFGPGWRVVNVAKNGWCTPDAIDAFQHEPAAATGTSGNEIETTAHWAATGASGGLRARALWNPDRVSEVAVSGLGQGKAPR